MLSIGLIMDTTSYSSILSTWKHCSRDAGLKSSLKLCVLVDKTRRFDILVIRDLWHTLCLMTYFMLSIYDINLVYN